MMQLTNSGPIDHRAKTADGASLSSSSSSNDKNNLPSSSAVSNQHTSNTTQHPPPQPPPQQLLHLTHLPDELLVALLSYLPVQDLCMLSSVCRRLHCLAQEESLWKSFCEREGALDKFPALLELMEGTEEDKDKGKDVDEEEQSANDDDVEETTTNNTWKQWYKEAVSLHWVLPEWVRSDEILFDESKLTATRSDAVLGWHGHTLFRANRAWSSGRHYWEVKVDVCHQQIFIGVISAHYPRVPYIGGGWGWSICPFGPYAQGEGRDNVRMQLSPKYTSFNSGDVIGIELDCDNGSISFWQNDVFLGTPFRNSQEILAKRPLCAAVSMMSRGERCTANFKAKRRKSAEQEEPVLCTRYQPWAIPRRISAVTTPPTASAASEGIEAGATPPLSTSPPSRKPSTLSSSLIISV
ncbi:negative regulation of SNARE complex assembly [Balamuthia mandrillaris]